MATTITIFITSVSANQNMRSNIGRAEMILSSKNIAFEKVDVAGNDDEKNRMRELAQDSTALPLQFAKGDTYLGDFAAFDEAVENGEVEKFCKM